MTARMSRPPSQPDQMLPSPSLGPPWLSASLSPAFAPCGMPDEAELPEPEPVDEAAGGDALDDFEEDEPPPHPATARAATVSANPNHRRAVIQLMFIGVPLLQMRTADPRHSFP